MQTLLGEYRHNRVIPHDWSLVVVCHDIALNFALTGYKHEHTSNRYWAEVITRLGEHALSSLTPRLSCKIFEFIIPLAKSHSLQLRPVMASMIRCTEEKKIQSSITAQEVLFHLQLSFYCSRSHRRDSGQGRGLGYVSLIEKVYQ